MESSSSFAPPRGMRDFYPKDMVFRERLFEIWKNSARRFGFSPYDACVVESLDLLKRKAGEEIVDQIYSFVDKSGRALALRPEMTPTLARMIAAHQGSLRFPLKWYAIAQCFRYERMTRGRKREHYQWNLDIVGEESVTAEIELVACAAEAMAAIGFSPSDYRIHFSNRALLADLLSSLGIAPQHYNATFLALDKRRKIPDEEIRGLLQAEGLNQEALAPILELMDIGTLEEIEKKLNHPTPALQRTKTFREVAAAYGLGNILTFDIAVIRGLSYYTGIVFEAFDAAGHCRAIFGGGRYDNLLADIGGRPISAVGLGFGDVVVAELAREKHLLAEIPSEPLTVVGYLTEQETRLALQVSAALRRKGRNVDLRLRPEKARSFFSYAGDGHAAEAVFLGPDEASSGVIRIKNLQTGIEQRLKIEDLLAELKP